MRIDINTVRNELQHVKAEIARLSKLESQYDGLLALLDGSGVTATYGKRAKFSPTGPTGVSKKGRRGKRSRRTAAQMEADTMKIVEFIKAAGPAGRTGSEINSNFFPGGPQGFTTKGRLERYAPGLIKYKGKRASMTYHYVG